MPARKVIVSCAVTGSIHVPSQSDALPVTPGQIAEQAIGAAEAGATILHLHARDPETGRPSPDPYLFAQFLPEIRSRCNAVLIWPLRGLEPPRRGCQRLRAHGSSTRFRW